MLPVTILLACNSAQASAGLVEGRLQGNPWLLHIVDSTSEGADGVRLGDINRDGLPDIATGWEEGGRVRVYLNPGSERSTQRWPLVTVGKVADVEDAVFADLDGDGRPEVVSSCEGNTRAMYVHYPPARRKDLLAESTWRTERIEASAGLMQWMFCAPVLLEPDSGPSLVAAGKNDNAAIGLFTRADVRDTWRWKPLATVGWTMSIRVLDMDGDGDPDILYTDRKGEHRGVRWLENPGKKSTGWRDNLIGGDGYEVMFLDTADLDGDGELELAVAAKPGNILVFDRQSGGWKSCELHYPAGTGRAKAVAIADFDLDGRMDLVASCEGAVSCTGVFWIRVDKWPEPDKVEYFDISGKRGIKFDRIECLDLDGDGDLDVLTTDERDNLGVIWYENPTR